MKYPGTFERRYDKLILYALKIITTMKALVQQKSKLLK